ncbi:hypothetical protein NUU61_009527 [Penicillium alfredii]|uniref:Uncharacterized protein n=1 Tax=Penicillium alfredii TaxID=1506179 RepID=A0A9W9EN84_9EURO|nr:uncharacterized protein NUU61_009527 [Penicillium alfredii]KAJ5084948.1 hypothetical protein NUU61_009527 [Penicillium alfredii]
MVKDKSTVIRRVQNTQFSDFEIRADKAIKTGSDKSSRSHPAGAESLVRPLGTKGQLARGRIFPRGRQDALIHTSSGRKIVDILAHNPTRNPSAYTDQDIDHMRRVVSYCKRHIVQERNKHDLRSRSYRSLKNWGHDSLKE